MILGKCKFIKQPDGIVRVDVVLTCEKYPGGKRELSGVMFIHNSDSEFPCIQIKKPVGIEAVLTILKMLPDHEINVPDSIRSLRDES